MKFNAAIFDMDGVITDTAKTHFHAWKKIFDEFLKQHNSASFKPFTEKDYLHYVDGVDRLVGVKNFLHSRHLNISLSVMENLAEQKTRLFLRKIKNGVKTYPGTIEFIRDLKKNNIAVGVISASKNCKLILKKARVIQLFDTIVDGTEHLKSKPDPAIFLEAARRLSAKPRETIVIEDALAGIKAAKSGKFGLTIAIDRKKTRQTEFKLLGANHIVQDLSLLSYHQIKNTFDTIPNLALNELRSIKIKLQNKHLVMCLDFDGTLTPIVDKPELAIISKKMKALLTELKRYCPIIIITGRELKNIQKKIAIDDIYYAGNHGFEIVIPGIFPEKIEQGTDFLKEISTAYKKLQETLISIEHCLIENKRFSLSIHYRLVDHDKIHFIESSIDRIIEEHPSLIKHHGKKVFEIRPKVNWNKGKALHYLLKNVLLIDRETTLPIYIGDDLSDEDVFDEIKNYGIGILVSEKTKDTKAHYRLKNVEDVYRFLKKLSTFAPKHCLFNYQHSTTISYHKFSPEEEKFREALNTLGNGYFATRGAGEESHADEIHYPGTYFAGCYNKLTSILLEKKLINEDLVNMPNWLSLNFSVDEHTRRWFSLADYHILHYQQILNMRNGTLERFIRFKDSKERVTTFKSIRLVHMGFPHVAALTCILSPENWSGKIIIKSGLDGTVTNKGVERYRGLNAQHLVPLALYSTENGLICLEMQTTHSHIEIAQTAKHAVYKNMALIQCTPINEKKEKALYHYYHVDVGKNENLSLEKIVAMATSKDHAISEVMEDTKLYINFNKSFNELLQSHKKAWETLWKYADIRINSHDNTQQLIRLHIFHLLQTASKHTIELDVSTPARGLHGEAYRGHIFWDELFILPFYNFHFPSIARALLLYRYRRLPIARHLAKEAGYAGAMYPWQSASNGDEASQVMHLNPVSKTWTPDYSRYQRHINAAIVYNIWHYYLATNDLNFMNEYGAEMIFEIAKFWKSISTFNSATKRYEINGVMGPDEYHEKYPLHSSPGLKNNAYTNIMAVWSIEKALCLLKLLPQKKLELLKEQLHIDDQIIQEWHAITAKMKISFHAKNIISQFEGYEKLQELDWDNYRKRYGNIERLDRILKAEGDSADAYKISKQADVLMLFYLFPPEELSRMFNKLGYAFNKNILKKNVIYYAKRTSHGSTLSKLVFASVYYYLNKDEAMKYFKATLNCDFIYSADSTTQEGIHLGAMAGCVNVILQRFAGLHIKNHHLHFMPKLPTAIKRVKFSFLFHEQWFTLTLHENSFTLISHDNITKKSLPIYVFNKRYYLWPPNSLTIKY